MEIWAIGSTFPISAASLDVFEMELSFDLWVDVPVLLHTRCNPVRVLVLFYLTLIHYQSQKCLAATSSPPRWARAARSVTFLDDLSSRFTLGAVPEAVKNIFHDAALGGEIDEGSGITGMDRAVSRSQCEH